MADYIADDMIWNIAGPPMKNAYFPTIKLVRFFKNQLWSGNPTGMHKTADLKNYILLLYRVNSTVL